MAPKNLSKTKETTQLVMTTQQQEVQQNNTFAEQPTMQLNQEVHPAVQMLQNQIEEKMPLETAQMDSVEMAEKAYEEVHGKKSESKSTRWNIKRNVKRKSNRVSNLKKAENEFETEKQKMTPSQESVYKELENLDLSVLQVKNDEQFIEKYQQLSRAIYLAEQAKNWAGIVEGEKAKQRMTKVAVTRKAIEKIRPFFEAKKQIMNNPYYVLLQGSDVKQMSSEEMQKRYETAQQEGKQELAEFYKAVLQMESLKKQGNYLKEPDAAAESARQEEKEWRKEVMSLRREQLVKLRIDKETDPKIIEEIQTRAKWSLMAQEADEKQLENRNKKIDMIEQQVPETKEVFGGKRQWFAVMSSQMSDEQLISRYRKLASSDLDVRTEEVIQLFKEYIEMDLSCFKLGSPEALLENAENNLWLINAGFQLAGLMEWVLADGMEIPMEIREQLWKRYEFFCRISKTYKGEVETMQHVAYGLMTEKEMPKTEDEIMMLMTTGEYEELKDFAGKLVTGMMEDESLQELDKNVPVEEQWKNHKATPMPDKFFTKKEREQKNQ